jgi:hypothetical protein
VLSIRRLVKRVNSPPLLDDVRSKTILELRHLTNRPGFLPGGIRIGSRAPDGLKSLTATLLVVISLACGCRPRPGLPSLDTTQDFIDLARSAGVQVSPSAEAAVRIQAGRGSVWRLNVSLVEIYEFDDPAERAAASQEASLIWEVNEHGRLPHVWGQGGLLIVYPGSDGGTILLLHGLLGDPILRPAVVGDEPHPPSVTAAIERLAVELGVDPALIDVIYYRDQVWPDACLGLGAPGEACAEAQVPGWRVVLRHEKSEVELRTDETGSVIRREPR